MDEKEIQGRAVEIQSLELMGAFLVIFGVMVIVAAFFPMNFTGKIANAIVGVLLSAIGGILFMKGRNHRKKPIVRNQ